MNIFRLKRLSSISGILLLFICSISASESSAHENDPDFLTHSLLVAEEHRTLFIDEMSEVPKESLVLFTVGPGGGDFYGQYVESIKMQKVPSYFLSIAETNPSISAKIFAIDPSFSLDCNAPEYTFLYENGWELVTQPIDFPSSPLRFIKDNIEIVFFKFVIPDKYTGELSNVLVKYTTSILDSGGCVFMGHHGSAFGGFSVFTNVYNLLQKEHMQANNIIMYICSGNRPPWSNPKVYHNVPYDPEELDTSYDRLAPFFEKWIPKSDEWDPLSWEQQRNILEEYDEGFIPRYKVYHDLGNLDVTLENSDGNFRLQLSQ